MKALERARAYTPEETRARIERALRNAVTITGAAAYLGMSRYWVAKEMRRLGIKAP